MFDAIWECEIDNLIFQNTLDELMTAVVWYAETVFVGMEL